MAENQAGPALSLEKVYIKDVSFESPGSPMVFMSQDAPDIGIDLNIVHRKLENNDGYYEVILNAEVDAKAGDTTIFLAELQQAGLFMVRNVPENEIDRILEVACPQILFPFVREAINDFVCKGGFPQLLINPVNFDALYAKKLAVKQQQEEAAQ